MITVDIQSSAGGAPVVDLIVPVYRGLAETRRCLDSVLAFPQQTSHEIVVIDDCSPEPELSVWLRDLADTGAITLLENPVNTGFVNAVNRGMVLHPDRDVVLLNSDTEVHGDWLDRLRGHAYSDPMIGTVTPFSNNATLCSYPRFMQDNPLPEGWPLANAGCAVRRGQRRPGDGHTDGGRFLHVYHPALPGTGRLFRRHRIQTRLRRGKRFFDAGAGSGISASARR